MPSEAEVQTMREEAVAQLLEHTVHTLANEYSQVGFYDDEWVKLVHYVDILEQMTEGWPCVKEDTIEPLRGKLNQLYISGVKLEGPL